MLTSTVPNGATLFLLAMLISAAKATVIVLIAWIATLFQKKSAASVRHAIWAVAICGTLIVPLVGQYLPQHVLAIIPEPQITFPAHTPIPISTPAAVASVSSTPKMLAEENSNPEAGRQVATGYSPVSQHPTRTENKTAKANKASMTWEQALIVVWWTVAGLATLRLLYGLAVAQWINRNSASFAFTSTSAVTNCTQIKIGTKITQPLPTVPMAIGAIRPTILLPQDADTWPPERVRAAIAHEFAHIKRNDWLIQIIAYLACACYWFNPLLWLVARQLRIESEYACDDLAMESGVAPTDYARHLIDVARGVARRNLMGAAAVSMAQTSKIESRIKGILSVNRKRGGISRTVILRIMLVSLLILIPLAVIRLAAKSVANTAVIWNGVPIVQSDSSIVNLPNGSEVKLVGVSDSQLQRGAWWDASGNTIGKVAQSISFPTMPGTIIGRRFEFTISTQLSDLPEAMFEHVIGSSTTLYSGYVDPKNSSLLYAVPNTTWLVAANGTRPPVENDWIEPETTGASYKTRVVMSVQLPKDTRTSSLMVGVASGPWTNVVDCPVPLSKSVIHTNSGDVAFTIDRRANSSIHPKHGPWQNALFTISDHFGDGYDQRMPGPFGGYGIRDGNYHRELYGLNSKGEVIDEIQFTPINQGYGIGSSLPAKGYYGLVERGKTMIEGAIPNSVLSKIAKFRLVARPYQWVEFKNIAINPTIPTAAQAAVSNRPAQSRVATSRSENQKYTVVPDNQINTNMICPGNLANFADGVKASVVGVTEISPSSSHQWWSANGTLLPAAPKPFPQIIPRHMSVIDGIRWIAVAVEVDDPKHAGAAKNLQGVLSLPMSNFDGDMGGGDMEVPIQSASGDNTKYYFTFYEQIPNSVKLGHMRLEVTPFSQQMQDYAIWARSSALAPWYPVAGAAEKYPIEVSGNPFSTTVTMSNFYYKAQNEWLNAIGADDKPVHFNSYRMTPGYVNTDGTPRLPFGTMTTTFPAAPTWLRELHYQVQVHHWHEIQDVAMYPAASVGAQAQVDGHSSGTGVISGTVYGMNGKPASDVGIEIDGGNFTSNKAISDRKGHYQINKVNSGRHEVELIGQNLPYSINGHHDIGYVAIPYFVNVDEGESVLGVDLHLVRGALLNITVTDTSSNPVCYANVSVYGPGPELFAMSGRNGMVQVRIPAGQQTIHVESPNCQSLVEVHDGQTLNVLLTPRFDSPSLDHVIYLPNAIRKIPDAQTRSRDTLDALNYYSQKIQSVENATANVRLILNTFVKTHGNLNFSKTHDETEVKAYDMLYLQLDSDTMQLASLRSSYNRYTLLQRAN